MQRLQFENFLLFSTAVSAADIEEPAVSPVAGDEIDAPTRRDVRYRNWDCTVISFTVAMDQQCYEQSAGPDCPLHNTHMYTTDLSRAVLSLSASDQWHGSSENGTYLQPFF